MTSTRTTWEETLTDNPWRTVPIPTDPAAVSARRVDENGRWNFFWGRDSAQRYSLILRFSPAAAPQQPLPRLRGVEVVIAAAKAEEPPSLVLSLIDASLRDVFLQLCNDVMASAASAASEREAVSTTVARTWRWHYLLRGGNSGLLSGDEQKGLIGELLVLERYLLPTMAALEAVTAWRGPLGAARDFTVGPTGIESKARTATLATTALISSEFQLDDAETPSLFLHVCAIDTAHEDTDAGYTVTDVATRVRDRISAQDAHACERFLAVLAASGFRFEDDYSQQRWSGGERSIYRVADAFPRIMPGSLPQGISAVKYSVNLAECAAFIVAPQALEAALRGVPHGT
jgi:hypothetical protein